MRDFFFYSLMAGLATACVVGTLFTVEPAYVLFGLLICSGLGLVLWRGGGQAAAPPLLFSTVIFLCAFTLTLSRVTTLPAVTTPALDKAVGREVTLKGIVLAEPDLRARSQHLIVKTENVRLRVTTDRFVPIQYGDLVTVTGRLAYPESFTTELGRTFNYPGYLRARGIGYTVSFAEVTVERHNGGSSLVKILLSVKQNFITQLEQVIPAPTVGLAEGLLLGVKRALGESYEQAFRQTGLTHIVVLSGYNIMLVVTFFMYVLAYLLPYRVRLVVGVIAIILFALLVGASASVVRASIMASLLLFIRFGGFTHHLLRALLVAAAVMLLYNPHLLLFDVGFQLSFLATFALITLAPMVANWATFLPETLSLREFAVATVTTQLLVSPLLLYQMGQVSVIAVIANVLVLPMVPVAMLLTFLTGVISYLWSPLAILVGYTAYLSLEYILTVVTVLAKVPLASISLPTFGLYHLIATYLVGGLVWWYFRWQPQVREPVSPFASWTIEEERV